MRRPAALLFALLVAVLFAPLTASLLAQSLPPASEEPPLDPPEVRLTQNWRWRAIDEKSDFPSYDFVGPWLDGGIVAREDHGLHIYDGWKWTLLPGSEPFAEGDLSDVLPSGDGYVVVRHGSLTAIDAEGRVRERLHVDEHSVPGRALAAPDGSWLLPTGKFVLTLPAPRTPRSPGWSVRWTAPEAASRLAGLALDALGRVLAISPEGLWRRTDSRWEALAKVQVETGPEVLGGRPLHVLSAGGLTIVLPEHLDESDSGFLLSGDRVEALRSPSNAVRVKNAVALADGTVIVLAADATLLVLREGRWYEVILPLQNTEAPSSLAVTSSGRLVVSSRAGKLWSCDLMSRRWTVLDPMPGVPGPSVNTIARARAGGFWLGTTEGLLRWDGQRFHELVRVAGQTGVRLARLTAVHEDAQGDLWVGSGSGFSGVLQLRDGNWTLHERPEIFRQQFVHAIYEVDGELWLLLLGNPDIDFDSGSLVRYSAAGFERIEELAGRPLARTYSLTQPSPGRLLLGTRDTVYLREGLGESATWSVLPENGPGGESLLGPRPAFALHESEPGLLWIGTGLDLAGLVLNEHGRSRLLQEGGWRNAAAASFVPGPRPDSLWIAGAQGLYLVDGFNARRVSARLNNERFWPSLPDEDGGLWLGHLGAGLVRFRPDDDQPPRTSRLETLVDVDDRGLVLWEAADAWNDTAVDELRLRWRLDGGPWQETSGGRELNLQNAGWGVHELEVQAVDDFGNVEPELRRLSISLPAPLLLRPPMLALMGALAGALLSVGWLVRRRQRERQQARAEQDALTRQLEALTLALLSTQEEERKRLSRDMHDDLGQLLTAICLDVQRAAALQNSERRATALGQALRTARQALDRVREISSRLRPTVLDDHGLPEAVGTNLAEFTVRTGVDVRSEVALEGVDVPPAIAAHVFRILQESLTNVARHATAETADVVLRTVGGSIELIVRDDGRGFDPGRPRSGQHIGLLSMRERAELLGGTFELSSRPGAGTTIRVTIPLVASERHGGVSGMG
ncbi:MAG: sensor histidine kinase [Planctomycetota bacterium]